MRLGIGTSKDIIIPVDVDWIALKALADQQGLTAVVLDGLNVVINKRTDIRNDWFPSQVMTIQWIGEVLQNYEAMYKQYVKSISSLAGFYSQHGYKMMVMKGYACSLDWPKPEHRPTGDIDIWQFGEWKLADVALAKEKDIVIDNSHHHHTVFTWQGFTVENHYDFINVHHHKSHKELEKVLKKLGEDDSYYVELNGEKVYLPSPNLHALFLLKHAALHFVGTELTFRQILDWAFFLHKHGKEVDWKMLLPVIDEYGMTPFLNTLNSICVEDFGFDAHIFPTVQFNTELKDRVVNEVFSSVYDGDKSKNVFVRSFKRYQRWRSNAWKHELCYRESMWSAFWSGVWGHLLKPKSI